MRIAFIGSHSTGKTTVAKPVAQALGLPFLSEVAREVARHWGYTPATIPTHLLLDYQQRILRDQMVGEQGAWLGCSGFVSDRSTLDNAAYFLAYVAFKASPEAVYNYLHAARANLDHYDRLILIPPMFPPVDDGERHTDPREQQRIHEIVCDLIAAWGVAQKVYTVTSRTPEERVAEIMEVLGHA